MSFTKNNNENNQITNKPVGLMANLASLMPILTIALEQMSGQKVPPMSGTIADILTILQRLEVKLDNLERNCSEQFIHQEEQLNSLQQISKLVSTEKTKAIHFASSNKQITEINE